MKLNFLPLGPSSCSGWTGHRRGRSPHPRAWSHRYGHRVWLWVLHCVQDLRRPKPSSPDSQSHVFSLGCRTRVSQSLQVAEPEAHQSSLTFHHRSSGFQTSSGREAPSTGLSSAPACRPAQHPTRSLAPDTQGLPSADLSWGLRNPRAPGNMPSWACSFLLHF